MIMIMFMLELSRIEIRRHTSLNLKLALVLVCFAISPNALKANENGISTPVISQENFIYTPSQMLSFDIEAYLLENAPNLAKQAGVISHWSGRTSISPKVIISLIEYESQGINHSHLSNQQDSALLSLSAKENFAARVQDVATRLADHYYKNLAKGVTKPEMISLDVLLGERKSISSVPEYRLKNGKNSFAHSFFSLFPNDRTTAEVEQNIKQLKSLPAPDLFQLPYPVGQAWQTWGGTHTFTGSGSAPYSSLDFRQNRNSFGTNTSNIWVSSASQGRGVKHSSCFVEVLASGGWSTTYYHLDNVQINTGQNLSKNSRLANYADNLSQSLCDGGQSNGPHLHFSLKRNGVYVALDGVKLSGYEVHAGRSNYDSDCSHFWLSNSNARLCNGTPIPNNRLSTTAPDLSVSVLQTIREQLNINQAFSVVSKLENLGSAPAGTSRLLFLLSTDSTITPDDTILSELVTDALVADESALYSANSLRLTVAGSFWLGVCVTPASEEINTANNCSAALPITVSDTRDDSVLPAIILLLDDG